MHPKTRWKTIAKWSGVASSAVIACVLSYRQGRSAGKSEAYAVTADIVRTETCQQHLRSQLTDVRAEVEAAKRAPDYCRANYIREAEESCLEQANQRLAQAQAHAEAVKLIMSREVTK